jgi:hypothetical protein
VLSCLVRRVLRVVTTSLAVVLVVR